MTSPAEPKMSIQTVLGPIAAHELGVTLPHEHLVIDFSARDSDRLRILATLLEHGHLDRVLLLQDVCNKARLKLQGGYGYAHLLRSVRDRLCTLGVSESEQQTLFEENPRRKLTPSLPAR